MSGKVVAAAIVGMVVLGIIMGVSFGAAIMGFYNTAVKMENGIKAQYEQNKDNDTRSFHGFSRFMGFDQSGKDYTVMTGGWKQAREKD